MPDRPCRSACSAGFISSRKADRPCSIYEAWAEVTQPSGHADLSGLARVICLAGPAEVQGFAGLLALIWLRGVMHLLGLCEQQAARAGKKSDYWVVGVGRTGPIIGGRYRRCLDAATS